MTAKTTDRPWRAITFDNGFIRDSDNDIVCQVDNMEQRDLIVTAVNAYDKLVSDNKAMVEALIAVVSTSPRAGLSQLWVDGIKDIARAALAQARGE